MDQTTSRPSERAAVVATIDPDAYATGTQVSDYVDFREFGQLMAIIQAGTLGASATLNAKLVQATSATGAGSKDVTSAAITALTQAGSDSDKQAIINCAQTAMDLDNGFNYVAISMTIAAAASDAGAVLLGFDPTYGPASDNDLASVDEIVSV